jgi:hypothetical protein
MAASVLSDRLLALKISIINKYTFNPSQPQHTPDQIKNYSCIVLFARFEDQLTKDVLRNPERDPALKTSMAKQENSA